MNKLGVGVIGAIVLCMVPFSVQWSTAKSGALSVAMDKANAAELAIPRHRRAYYHGRYYGAYTRAAYYDPYCGGPYTGGGWMGGTYYGGPWIDLRCYGVSPWSR